MLQFRDMDILMPGYTHLQKAQGIRWSQWLMWYVPSLYIGNSYKISFEVISEYITSK